MTKETVTEEVIFCFHCGNKTKMKLEGECLYQIKDQIEIGDYLHGITFNDNYLIFICPVCHNATIKKVHTNSEDTDFDGSPIVTEDILYPHIEVNMTYLPKNIQKAYESALKVKNIDNAISAISLRRTLEMVCKDKGETQGNLYNKLKNLSDKGILPAILDEMAQILKDVGNAAAHADDIDFSDSVLEALLEFTQTILDYIYKLPIRLERVQSQLLGIMPNRQV
ncbi:DUF4145 domain-containing protein [Radiobacillus sp. PE A8.2]|uniref:DUF4145 domain-containing protein n=1 Tax=Radiobacillus sp. PE A8.2 TaxID=3380349 RepID=UPI003890F2EE